MWSAMGAGEGYSLLQKGVFFFAAVLTLVLLLAGAVFYELTGGISMGNLVTADITGIHSLRRLLLLLTPFCLLFFTLFGGLIFFIRCIAVPLDAISIATHRMLDGQLDQPVQIAGGNEIGLLGGLINDLAMNMQELLLYFWNRTQENCVLIEQIEKRMHDLSGREDMEPLVKEIFTRLQQGNNDVKSMILLYDFMDLKLEREKMLINYREK